MMKTTTKTLARPYTTKTAPSLVHTDKMTESERVRAIVKTTGLSEFSLRVHAAMMNKTTPLCVDTLFRVVCPNREIRSLCKDELNRLVPQPVVVASTGGGGGGEQTTPKKPPKKSDDDKRKLIIRERERVLTTNGVKIAGTVNARKKLPLQQKDLTLRWEFLAWGQTASNFFVYLYYVGPADKGENYEALLRHEKWLIVPESHLAIFHKHITDIHAYLQQTVFDVRETIDKNQHIEYDVRYILYKWRTCAKGTRKETVALVNDNLALFERKDTLRIKEHKKRKLEDKGGKEKSRHHHQTVGNEATTTECKKRKRSTMMEEETATTTTDTKQNTQIDMTIDDDDDEMDTQQQQRPHKQRRIYEVRAEKYRRIPTSSYQQCVRYPLGVDGVAFGVENIRTVMENAVADEDRHPDSFRWDPVDLIVKPLMMANDPVLFRRQLVTKLIKQHNLCSESHDFNLLHQFINTDEQAADDIKRAFESFAWSCVYLNLIVIPGMVPEEIDSL